MMSTKERVVPPARQLAIVDKKRGGGPSVLMDSFFKALALVLKVDRLILSEVSMPSDSKSRRSYWCSLLPAASFLFLIFFAAYAFIAPDYKENQCRPPGSEALPEGIVSKTSNFQMRPLWGFPEKDENSSINLFAMAVGIKQRVLVNAMVKKRFLHPDIVAEYSYIFLWDEDLGVENFNPKHEGSRKGISYIHGLLITIDPSLRPYEELPKDPRTQYRQCHKYVSIVKSEGLHISQPALGYTSLIHQQITARASKSGVHRRTYKPGLCDGNSTAPPCTGWVEMMAPVFSRAAWRCVWYMIQKYNSSALRKAACLFQKVIKADTAYYFSWVLKGDRTKNIGVVDAEYIVHYGHPTLGGVVENEAPSRSHKKGSRMEARSHSRKTDPRLEDIVLYLEIVFIKVGEEAVLDGIENFSKTMERGR
ncbi:unnamed protein product [Dovyalis caffra]|uniref:Glycosyltransferase family 92 protein n=1 Tax=Dovyalis caffra TaxID=77055 RepID=A0AAV1RVP0_9ROSI|nr:unnamed protein product [Dovyalis caffra]